MEAGLVLEPSHLKKPVHGQPVLPVKLNQIHEVSPQLTIYCTLLGNIKDYVRDPTAIGSPLAE